MSEEKEQDIFISDTRSDSEKLLICRTGFSDYEYC